MSPKVSIIVPTYNTEPDRLDRLVRSIEEQTLPSRDYEVVFVDDGSTSGVYDEIERLAERHDNFSATQIENSGWACRPRNVGTSMAKGEYVLFMDHDDVLFPEGLERSYAYGAQHDADVVNHKEIRTDGWAWSWGRFLKDDPEAQGQGVACLIPMTPHKLYRRSFLLEHDVAFDEGARVLWEDVYFNTRVWAHQPRVAVLANYPVYHWANTGENTSSTFGRDEHERWGQLHKLLRFFHETLPEGRDRDYLVGHWYKSRVLAVVSGNLDKKSDERLANELRMARETSASLVPDRIKKRLSPWDRARQRIIDRGDLDAARAFAEAQRGIGARSHTENVHWSGSSLVVSARTTVTGSDGSPLGLVEKGNSVLREVDRPFAELFEPGGAGIKNPAGKASFELTLKARRTREIWPLPDRGSAAIVRSAGGPAHLDAEITGTVDVLSAAFGRPLGQQVWEIGARLTALGKTMHRGVVADHHPTLMVGALISGTVAVAYRNKWSGLSLDIGGRAKSLVETVDLGSVVVQVRRGQVDTELLIPLPGVHVHGRTRLPGRLRLQPGTSRDGDFSPDDRPALTVDALLLGDEQGARIEATAADLPHGEYRITTQVGGREHETSVVVDLAG